MRSKPNANTDRNANPDTNFHSNSNAWNFSDTNAYSDTNTQGSVTVWLPAVNDDFQAKEKLTAFPPTSILPHASARAV